MFWCSSGSGLSSRHMKVFMLKLSVLASGERNGWCSTASSQSEGQRSGLSSGSHRQRVDQSGARPFNLNARTATNRSLGLTHQVKLATICHVTWWCHRDPQMTAEQKPSISCPRQVRAVRTHQASLTCRTTTSSRPSRGSKAQVMCDMEKSDWPWALLIKGSCITS